MVQEKLELEWSPEQIAAWLRCAYPERAAWHLCHQTVYQALYHGGRGGLSRHLTTRLRTGRPLRKRRRRPAQRTPRYVVPAPLIDQRPRVVETRSRVGDWEGDLVVGRHSRSAIATLVDRHSRVVRLVHLPHGHSADAVAAALTGSLRQLPTAARQTLTWDQGSEMAAHHQLAPLFNDGVYVAFAGAPWQRGSNENTNGLLRQYFPKGSDLSRHGPAELLDVEQRLNRPRKTLGWKTPSEVFVAALPSSTTTGVATATRIRPGTQAAPKGQHSTVVDRPAGRPHTGHYAPPAEHWWVAGGASSIRAVR